MEQESRNITQQLCRMGPKIYSPHIQMRRWPCPLPFVIFKAIESAPFQSISHLNALVSDTNRELLSRQFPRQLSINNPSRWTEIDLVLNPSISQGTKEGKMNEKMEGRREKKVLEGCWDIIYQNRCSETSTRILGVNTENICRLKAHTC